MLTKLLIRDYALLSAIDFEPGAGFCALTGETGAGKSLIIDALSALSGERADSGQIRSGEALARLEGVFTVEAGQPVSLVRELSRSGRNQARLNGRLVTLAELRARAETLVQIHGQRESQRIFDESTHRELLDRFAERTVGPLLFSYEGDREKYRDLLSTLGRLGADPARRAERIELLSFQIEEIERAALQAGEEEELRERKKRFDVVSHMFEEVRLAQSALDGDERQSVTEQLDAAANALRRAGRQSRALAQIADGLQEAAARVEEEGLRLSRLSERLIPDPEEEARTQSRLEEIGRLKYKYGGTIEKIERFLARARAEHAGLVAGEAALPGLLAEKKRLTAELTEKSAALHEARRSAATELSRRIEKELTNLEMARVQFAIDVRWQPALSFDRAAGGQDEVVFGLSANVGEPLLPLARIASGGEAARVLLAIKAILAGVDDVGTLVFDEIDSGISGRTAAAVAAKLRELGRQRQVFAVTHSAAIAAAADHHYRIQKQDDGQRTDTLLVTLEGPARVSEIARLLSGKPEDEASLTLARQLLQQQGGGVHEHTP